MPGFFENREQRVNGLRLEQNALAFAIGVAYVCLSFPMFVKPASHMGYIQGIAISVGALIYGLKTRNIVSIGGAVALFTICSLALNAPDTDERFYTRPGTRSATF
jgi:hypothetical protein